MRQSGARRSQLAILLALALLVAACGSGGETTTTSGSSSTSPTVADSTTTTEVEETPEGLYLDGEFVIPQDMLEEARSGPTGYWYTSINETVSQGILDAFYEHTGIEMELVTANQSVVNERILTEFGAGILAADVIAMTDTYVPEYVAQGIVIPYEVEAIEELDERFYSDDLSYYALYTSPILLTYNAAILPEDQVPTSWTALTEKDRFSCGHGTLLPVGGAVAWTLAMFTRQAVSETFWEDHAAAEPIIYDGTASLTQDLARGEICIAPNTGTSTAAGIESGGEIKFVIPEEGIPVFDVNIGLSATGKNPAAGKAFMNWAFSRVGMLEAAPGYGARSDIPAPSVGPLPEHQLPPVSEAPFWKPDPQEYIDLRDPWTQEWYTTYGYVPGG